MSTIGTSGNDYFFVDDAFVSAATTEVVATGGNDTYAFSDALTTGIEIIYFKLTGGITVDIDGEVNTGSVNKGAAGIDALSNVSSPLGAGTAYPLLTITGTNFDDVFYIDGGADSFIALSDMTGNDIFNITLSGDVLLHLGWGNPGAINVDVRAGTVSYSDGETTIINVTSGKGSLILRGGFGNDILLGSSAKEIFQPWSGGNDEFDGRGGIDTVDYSQLWGAQDFAVNLESGAAGFLLSGTVYAHNLTNVENIVTSYSGDNRVVGSAASNRIEAGSGSDKLFAKGGADRVFGADGNDLIRGGNGNDKLYGNNGNDDLGGGNGRDILKGGGGKDVLDGGKGNDKMVGGGGADRFIFSADKDVITDFNAANNKEKIDLSDVGGITGFKDLKNNNTTQDGSDLVIDDGAGNTLTLLGLSIDDLDRGDFMF